MHVYILHFTYMMHEMMICMRSYRDACLIRLRCMYSIRHPCHACLNKIKSVTTQDFKKEYNDHEILVFMKHRINYGFSIFNERKIPSDLGFLSIAVVPTPQVGFSTNQRVLI